jgi:hypothetical protein
MADFAPRLRAPLRKLASQPRRCAGASGDLFEHFGVVHETSEPTLAAIVAAAPCPECGWLRPLAEDDSPDGAANAEPNDCPLCGGFDRATSSPGFDPADSTGCK